MGAVRQAGAPARPRPGSPGRLAAAADALVPAALVVYCAFNAGGYFPDAPGVVSAALLVALALRVAIVPRPFAGFGRLAGLAAGSLALLIVWTLVSMAWSHAPARAVLEANRTLAYLLAFVLAAAVPWRPGRLQALVRGLAVAAVVVCGAGLASRLLPTVFPTAPNVLGDRLSYPLTYWNALALLAAIGMTMCGQLACDAREPRAIRALAAAAFPILATTALLTFSRGGIAIAILALAVYSALARPPGLVRAALAIGLPTVGALAAAYSASALAIADAGAAGATAERARVAAVVVAAAAAAAAVMWWLPARVERRLTALPRRLGRRPRRAIVLAAAALALAAGTDVAVHQARGFGRAPAATGADLRGRLSDTSSSGRTEYWRVAREAFAAEPLHGGGAGTYQLAWWRMRRLPMSVAHAHSLYLETAAELGVVGLLPLLGALGTGIAALARRRGRRDAATTAVVQRRRGPDPAATALLVATLAWLAHAALDWDWEMPAVTIWLWAAVGAAAARPAPRRARAPLGLAPRAVVACALVAAAGVPALVAVSENRLEAADAAYEAGDCAAADSLARTADAALPLRPEPLALRGFCAARAGAAADAERLLDRAVDRDPGDWELRYDRAAVRAAAGADARADIAAALRLDPLQPEPHLAAVTLAGPGRRRAGRAVQLFLRGLDEPPLGGPSS